MSTQSIVGDSKIDSVPRIYNAYMYEYCLKKLKKFKIENDLRYV